jgi:hypothetical protein
MRTSNREEISGTFFDSFVKTSLASNNQQENVRTKERNFLGKPVVALPIPVNSPLERSALNGGASNSNNLTDSRSARSRGIFTPDEYLPNMKYVTLQKPIQEDENNYHSVSNYNQKTNKSLISEDHQIYQAPNASTNQRRPNSERRLPNNNDPTPQFRVLSDLTNINSRSNNLLFNKSEVITGGRVQTTSIGNSFKVERKEDPQEIMLQAVKKEMKEYYDKLVTEIRDSYESRKRFFSLIFCFIFPFRS